jgi:hypothetical protein
MLTMATLGFAAYGVFVAGAALFDMVFTSRLEIWANLGGVVFGLVLLLSSALVRVQIPGGLFFALGGLLALQALGLHNSMHLNGSIQVVPEVTRALFGAMLLLLARVGGRKAASPEPDEEPEADQDGESEMEGRNRGVPEG